jgi:hypothetical protein
MTEPQKLKGSLISIGPYAKVDGLVSSIELVNKERERARKHGGEGI